MSEALILEALARIEAEIGALREEVARGNCPPQRRVIGALLAAIFEAVADRPFTCYELVDHVDVAQAADLGKAITAACGSLSPRKVGKRLARLEGEPVDGYIVRRVGDSREGIRWRVSRVSSEQTPARSPRSR